MALPDDKLKWFVGTCVSVIFAVQFGSQTELCKENTKLRYGLYATGILTAGVGVLVCFLYETVSQHPLLHKQFGPFVAPVINTVTGLSIMVVVSFNEKSIESILFFYGAAWAVFTAKHFIGSTLDLGVYNFMVFAALAQAYLLDGSRAGGYVTCCTIMTFILLFLKAEMSCLPTTTTTTSTGTEHVKAQLLRVATTMTATTYP